MKNFKFKIHDNNYKVNILSHEGNKVELEVNGTSYSVKMQDEIKKTKTPTLVRAASKRPVEPIIKASSKTKVVSPLPGIIFSLKIKVGDKIKIGDTILILEAMKMENNISAEKSGTVTAIHVSEGQQVLQDELLIELE